MASIICNWPFHQSQEWNSNEIEWNCHSGQSGLLILLRHRGLASSQLFPISQGSTPSRKHQYPNIHSNLQHAHFCPSEKTCHLNLLNLLTCVSVQPLFLQELSTMHTGVQMCFLDWTEFNFTTVTSRTRATMLFPLCVSSPILNCRCEVFVDWLHNWTQE